MLLGNRKLHVIKNGRLEVMKRVTTINKCNSNHVYTGLTMQIIKDTGGNLTLLFVADSRKSSALTLNRNCCILKLEKHIIFFLHILALSLMVIS